jgi:hypothetical protein
LGVVGGEVGYGKITFLRSCFKGFFDGGVCFGCISLRNKFAVTPVFRRGIKAVGRCSLVFGGAISGNFEAVGCLPNEVFGGSCASNLWLLGLPTELWFVRQNQKKVFVYSWVELVFGEFIPNKS